MTKVKGKCKKCIGCNLLENEDFKEKEHCEYYIKDNNFIFNIILCLIELLVVIVVGVLFSNFIINLNMLCGG